MTSLILRMLPSGAIATLDNEHKISDATWQVGVIKWLIQVPHCKRFLRTLAASFLGQKTMLSENYQEQDYHYRFFAHQHIGLRLWLLVFPVPAQEAIMGQKNDSQWPLLYKTENGQWLVCASVVLLGPIQSNQKQSKSDFPLDRFGSLVIRLV